MFTPNALLWIAAVFVAFGLMMSAMAKREKGLVVALKDFVARHAKREEAKKAPVETADTVPETTDG